MLMPAQPQQCFRHADTWCKHSFLLIWYPPSAWTLAAHLAHVFGPTMDYSSKGARNPGAHVGEFGGVRDVGAAVVGDAPVGVRLLRRDAQHVRHVVVCQQLEPAPWHCITACKGQRPALQMQERTATHGDQCRMQAQPAMKHTTCASHMFHSKHGTLSWNARGCNRARSC